MKTLQFEAVKVALKQDKTGYILTLCLHPDEIPEDLMRDFVGSRYGVVMVRINESEEPLDREQEFGNGKAVRLAGILCKEPDFWEFLYDDLQIMQKSEKEASDWLRNYLNIQSRSELKTNTEAQQLLEKLNKDYLRWKNAS